MIDPRNLARLLLVALAAAKVEAASTARTAVRLSSTAADVVIRHALGEYEADGETNGAIRYKRLATAQPQAGDRYLFRSATGKWSITNTEVDVAASKKILIMSSESSSATPLGLSYRFYSGEGKWEADPSFAVTDASKAVAEKKRQVSERATVLAKQQAQAAAARTAAASAVAAEAEAASRARAAADRAAEKEKLAAKLSARRSAAEEQSKRDGANANVAAVEGSLTLSRQERIDRVKVETILFTRRCARASATRVRA